MQQHREYDSYDQYGDRAGGAVDGSSIPDAIKAYVSYLYHNIREKNLAEIQQMFEPRFGQLSMQYFPTTSWPHVDAIAELAEHDHVFCLLYRELYFRDIFARLQPTLQQRCEAWENYCSLFQVALHGQLNVVLPNSWLWAMVDEFVYQFQSFCHFRAKPKSRTEDELLLLHDCQQVWNALGVCNYLQALVDKSGIVYVLMDEREGGAAESFNASEGYDADGASNVLRSLGYFAIVGLLRVHCLLGDYHTALQRLSAIDLGRPGVYQRNINCHISVMYCYGFASMRLRRYVDAIKAFNQILLTINKTRQYLQQMEGAAQPQMDLILSRSEHLFALLAICLALCPSGKLVEESVNAQLREKLADKIQKMQRGDLATFDELFSFACPKFVTPSPPDFTQPLVNYNQNAYRVQLKLFLEDVKGQTQLPGLRAALALYSAISLPRLAALLDTSETNLRTALVAFNHKNHVQDVDGAITSNSDLHFVINDDIVSVINQKAKRHFGEYFIRHVCRLEEIVAEVDAAQLE